MSNRLSQCVLLLRRARTVLTLSLIISVIKCSGHQIPSDATIRADQSLSSSLQQFLALNKIGIEIGDDALRARDRDELVMRLKRQFRAMISLPTALSNGRNVSQQCIEDSLFYVENLFIHRVEWALKSRSISYRS
jgi:hypothetical protein